MLDGQMYTQTKVQVGAGPVDVSKSATTAAPPPDEEPAVAAEPA